MKKLVAKQPIQYMGRMFAVGEPLPAHDQRMVGAWLGAESAEWKDTAAAPVTAAPASGLENEGWKAINALLDMGLILEDENGAFVGVENLVDQLRAIFTAENAVDGGQGNANTPDGSKDADGQESGAQAATGATSGENAAGASQEMVTGNLDAAQLEKSMSRDQLNDMATKMGLDISQCKNKGDVAKLIASAPVQALASEGDGGAQ